MRQTPLKTSLAAALVAVSLLAGTSAWALEYEEPRTQDGRSRVIDRLIAERDYQTALKELEIGLEINPANAQFKFKRAVLHARLGHVERARLLFEDMITAYPEIVEPYNNLAALYAQEGEYTKAKKLLERAVTINPNFAMGFENLGDLTLAMNPRAKTQASEYYRQALAITPNDKRIAAKLSDLSK